MSALDRFWFAWREGYLGVWSLAHIVENGETACGIFVPASIRRAPRTITRCAKCEAAQKTELEKIAANIATHFPFPKLPTETQP